LEAVTAGQIRRLLVTIPPRHGKSLIVSVMWHCWEWASRPDGRWLFASYAEALAIRDNVRSRRLIQSVWYQSNWGQVFQFCGDQNEKRKVETNRGGHRLAVGVAGSATGEGGSRLVIDDPHNIREVESDQVRKSVLDWHDQVWSTRANDPKNAGRVIIMQRCHQQDLAGHVLEQGGWEHLCIPAEYEGDKRKTSIGWSDPRTTEGELLWPAQFGENEIAESKQTLGSYAYSGQFQQRPAPVGGGILKKHWWRYWQPAGCDFGAVPVRFPDNEIHNIEPVTIPVEIDEALNLTGRLDASYFDEILQSWDLAFKDLKTSDFVAGQVWARKRANKFLLFSMHDRLDMPRTVQVIRQICQTWPACGAKLVEDRANGPAVIQTLRDEISGIVEVDPRGGKFARAAAVAPLIESGNVFVPHPRLAHWLDSFINEAASFPTGAHDDMVDAMSQGLIRLGHFSNRGVYDLYRQAAESKTQSNSHANGQQPNGDSTAAASQPTPKPMPSRPWRLR
jgi:predicted phage terminase large subunit-like protein